jgi:hypothetical protein
MVEYCMVGGCIGWLAGCLGRTTRDTFCESSHVMLLQLDCKIMTHFRIIGLY